MLSVIIPSYNSENTIEKCLNSLKSQSFSGEYEIIIVDSSADRTPHIVGNRYPDVQMIHLDNKTDPGTARNIGIKRARGEVIAFIDSDCIASKNWLERIWSFHHSSYHVVGGSVCNGNDADNLVAWAGYIAEFREFIPERPKREVPHIPTCNISYKKDIFSEYGYFRGEYYPQEDMVYNHHLTSHGVKILFEPGIRVYHHHRTRLKDFLAHQRRIGAVTSKVLRKVPLEGSFIVKYPLFSALIIPFLPGIKFLRTVFAFLKYQPMTIIKHPGALGVFAAGLVFWVIGFVQGMHKSH